VQCLALAEACQCGDKVSRVRLNRRVIHGVTSSSSLRKKSTTERSAIIGIHVGGIEGRVRDNFYRQ